MDPGLTRCGIAVVEDRPGRRAELIAAGVVRTHPDQALDERLAAIADGLDEWFDAHIPDVLAVERVFAQHNVSTVIPTAQVAGLAMVAARRRKVPVAQHTPSEVKAAVTGSGRAGKEQVQFMVARILGLAEAPKPADAADAAALAVCHLWRPAGLLEGADRLPHTAAQRAWAAAEQAARRKR
ncbi:crossover junction endodeoxyribonuclease RuvC [Rarobacter faecitabidus]|uniref:Crossover junction endodeoxyribonuclease RuvC n=1 Tax=Rarobacter faecitabidus TaxID=13243 RepID=A0A542ZV37_RARFA|nr:Holliday junction endonuclease RuvC [Rarobacter faecitabidus]